MRITAEIATWDGDRRSVIWRANSDEPRSDVLISSIRLWTSPGHDHLRVWNRGGASSGDLTVNQGDGVNIAARLLGVSPNLLVKTLGKAMHG